MSTSDAVIEIYGNIRDMDTLKGLAAIAYVDGVSVAWLEDVDNYRAELEIYCAAKEGSQIAFTKSDTRYPPQRVAQFCRSHGLSYHLSVGEHGADMYDTKEIWEPGFDKTVTLDLGGHPEPIVSVTELKEAASKGMDGVNALIKRLSVSMEPGVITVDEDVMNEWAEKNRLKLKSSDAGFTA